MGAGALVPLPPRVKLLTWEPGHLSAERNQDSWELVLGGGDRPSLRDLAYKHRIKQSWFVTCCGKEKSAETLSSIAGKGGREWVYRVLGSEPSRSKVSHREHRVHVTVRGLQTTCTRSYVLSEPCVQVSHLSLWKGGCLPDEQYFVYINPFSGSFLKPTVRLFIISQSYLPEREFPGWDCTVIMM